ncbi:GPI ethanolamine phosphate transferase 2 [Aspergillus crustosus]
MSKMVALPSTRLVLILIANTLIPIAILVFSLGFFPYKTLIPGLATAEQDAPPEIFDKVIFMVVDALRSDFVYANNSGFLYTQSLIRSGAAIPFTAHAGSPTVTMPRLKAITTGSVPSFLDVILNIVESDTSSGLAHQDTWLSQIRARGGNLIMYGDDTWLNLFPGMFTRADGTTSFFVSDFTEVDTNVTRHVTNELARDDWSAFIMHYLGLDHIGHKAGPQSSYMKPKQHEMDSVVKEVYRAMEKKEHLQSTLFVLCGDHGMNDAGNHGGSSAGETSPALLFISPKLQALSAVRESPVDAMDELQYYREVDQTDITPTLAGLLGLPIPLNSLGVFIPEFLDMWQIGSQRIRLLVDNSKQLLRTLEETYPAYNLDHSTIQTSCSLGSGGNIQRAKCAWARAQQLLHQYNAAAGTSYQTEVESALLHFLHVAQEVMSGAASNYDLRYLCFGLCITGIGVSFCLPSLYRTLLQYQQPGFFLMASIILYGVMMFASSYVEEEQQFWYWILEGWIFYLHARSFQSHRVPYATKSDEAPSYLKYGLTTMGPVILAVSHRIMRRWNQTGQKFAAEPDIAQSYFPSHQGGFWTLVSVTYANICLHLMNASPDHYLWQLLCVVVTFMGFTFKLAFAASESPQLLGETPNEAVTYILNGMSLVRYAQLAMIGIVILLPVSTILAKTNRRSCGRQVVLPNIVAYEALTLFLVTQSRVTNVPIFLMFRIQFKILASFNMTSVESTVTSLLMQYATFFAFGGSNAISSVDLSNSYNGIGSYNVVLVGILTYVGNWAGPIWWVFASKRLRAGRNLDENVSHNITLLTFYVASSLLSVMAACTALRTHLFIWTVFSPKYLYTMSWTVIHHFGVNMLGEVDLLFPALTGQ